MIIFENNKSLLQRGTGCQKNHARISKKALITATAPAPSVQGDTGILELGWKTTPASKNLELALGLEAYTGKQQGIGANASILWHF